MLSCRGAVCPPDTAGVVCAGAAAGAAAAGAAAAGATGEATPAVRSVGALLPPRLPPLPAAALFTELLGLLAACGAVVAPFRL